MPTIIEYAALAQDVYVDDVKGLPLESKYYAKSEILGGNWIGLQVIDEKGSPFKPGDKDFFARLYVNTMTEETVIAYRGTSLFDLGDDKADLQLTFNRKSQQDDDAIEFFKMAKCYLSKQVCTSYSAFPKVTGHSLGGYLAQLIAVNFSGVKAVVFNAPKINNFFVPGVGYVNPNDPAYKDRIYNVDLSTDLIHKVGSPVGTSINLMGNMKCFVAEHFNEIFFKHRNSIGLIEDTSKLYCGLIEHSINRVVEDIKADPAIASEIIK